jgi:hypothetical protein
MSIDVAIQQRHGMFPIADWLAIDDQPKCAHARWANASIRQ